MVFHYTHIICSNSSLIVLVHSVQVSPDGGIEDIFESPTLFNKKPPTIDQQLPGHFGYDEKAWNWYFFDVFASTFLVQFLSVTVSI